MSPELQALAEKIGEAIGCAMTGAPHCDAILYRKEALAAIRAMAEDAPDAE